ncbi:hypothetical protein E2562_036953 [Oryza meyeriana var. granulata]|uniref:Uncharacterized protein n=1 Tax=Oryza meyeriana var. granulata TaxID=110450 RepID=A0A6G1CBP2_9ORYZ|nr:hypothetical protein E2562_036953 [Oryza meyeriana var. granulata]
MGVYDPCSDARIHSGAFYSGSVQLSRCDNRLNLASSSQLAVFHPKVSEISLFTINSTTGFNPSLE